MKKASLQLEALVCPSCVSKIEKATQAMEGIDRNSVKVLFNSSKVKFDYDETKISLDSVEKAITALGYTVVKR